MEHIVLTALLIAIGALVLVSTVDARERSQKAKNDFKHTHPCPANGNDHGRLMPLAICNGSLRLRVKLRINGNETDVQLVSNQVITLHHQANTTLVDVGVALLTGQMAKSTMLRTYIVGDKFRSFDTAVVKQLRSKNIFDQTIKSPLKF